MRNSSVQAGDNNGEAVDHQHPAVWHPDVPYAAMDTGTEIRADQPSGGSVILVQGDWSVSGVHLKVPLARSISI